MIKEIKNNIVIIGEKIKPNINTKNKNRKDNTNTIFSVLYMIINPFLLII
jgi:hypothetical protein